MNKKIYYFDNAATSWPKPEKVYTAAERYLRNICGNAGRSGNTSSLNADRLLYETREKVATFLNLTDPSGIVFTLNATDALNIAIKGILKSGDHCIFTAMEHNSVLRPLGSLQREGLITTTMVPCDQTGNPDLDFFEGSFRKNTRLVVCNHASNVFGNILPIEKIFKISHEKDVLVLIDAAQTGGILPIDLKKVPADLMAFAGHKGFMGPPGTGMLYVKEGVDIKPFREGGTGSHSEYDSQPENMPEKLEAGTLNGAGIAGLVEGINYINETGIENIRSHEESLSYRLKKGLSALSGIKVYGTSDPQKSVSSVSFTAENLDPADIGGVLESHFGVICRTGLHCAPLAHKAFGTFPAGTVRLSPGYFTSKEDIDYVLNAISDIISLNK